jgi:hypothetical protein
MIPLIASLYFFKRQVSEAISPQAIANCLVFRAALQMPLNGGYTLTAVVEAAKKGAVR